MMFGRPPSQLRRPGCAMCGRPSVGKGFFDAICFGRCGHVFDLSMRRTWAAGHNALREDGSRPKTRALKRSGACGFSRLRLSTLVSITPCLPFPNSKARPARPPRPYAAAGSGSLKRSPLIIIAQIIRAILLASATAAILVLRRASNCTSQGRRVPYR
jgi:hypothetical protein